MAISLTKGQRVDIGLSRVGIGVGWDPGTSQHDFDLDASAFMLSDASKVPSEQFFVFYNNPKSPDGALASSGDDRTGGGSEGDDETLTVELPKVDGRVTSIVFCVSIHDADNRKQNFGQVRNSFIRIYDQSNNQEIAKYELDEDFSVETAVEFGRLYKRDNKWRFEATGIGYRGGLEALLQKYT